jgi:hypothetical protein
VRWWLVGCCQLSTEAAWTAARHSRTTDIRNHSFLSDRHHFDVCDMSFRDPQTPQSPSQFSPATSDPMTSMTSMPSASVTLPTPEHSIITSMSEVTHDGLMEDVGSSKRKRSEQDDSSEREQKKVHILENEVALDSLHLDVGDLYSLCQNRKAPPSPCHSILRTFCGHEFGARGITALPLPRPLVSRGT